MSVFTFFVSMKRERRSADKHPLMFSSLSFSLSLDNASWTCTQMNTLPPHTAMERTEGGGAPIGWCHLCRQLKLRLEIMVTFQERWCHSSTAASSSYCFPSTPGLLPPLPSPPHPRCRWLARLFESQCRRISFWIGTEQKRQCEPTPHAVLVAVMCETLNVCGCHVFERGCDVF